MVAHRLCLLSHVTALGILWEGVLEGRGARALLAGVRRRWALSRGTASLPSPLACLLYLLVPANAFNVAFCMSAVYQGILLRDVIPAGKHIILPSSITHAFLLIQI